MKIKNSENDNVPLPSISTSSSILATTSIFGTSRPPPPPGSSIPSFDTPSRRLCAHFVAQIAQHSLQLS